MYKNRKKKDTESQYHTSPPPRHTFHDRFNNQKQFKSMYDKKKKKENYKKKYILV